MEVFAWILLILLAIIAISITIVLGFLALYLFGMSYDSPNQSDTASAFLLRAVVLISPFGVGYLFFYWLSTAYATIQSGNPSRAVFLLSIGILVAIVAYIIFFIANKVLKNIPDKPKSAQQLAKEAEENKLFLENLAKKEAEEKKQKEEYVSKRNAAVQFAINETKKGCKITLSDDYRFENLLFYVFELTNLDGQLKKEYAQWNKFVPIFDAKRPQELDFSDLPNNQENKQYSLDFDGHNFSLTFLKQNDEIKSLQILN
jgi:uncharacterized membrane-anchored protein YhcB (DUF1043 family)